MSAFIHCIVQVYSRSGGLPAICGYDSFQNSGRKDNSFCQEMKLFDNNGSAGYEIFRGICKVWQKTLFLPAGRKDGLTECAVVFLRFDMTLNDTVKVIAFDADDTLWENQPYYDAAEGRFCNILSEYGVPGYIKEELFRTEMQNMAELGYGAAAFTLSMIETALRIGGETVSPAEISEIYSVGRSLLRIPAEPMSGVAGTLKKIRDSGRYRLTVVTKGNILDQERKLECSGLGKFFDHLEIVSDKTEKTYTDLLAFHSIKAPELLMVGNSFKSDIAPVLQIGAYGAYIPFHTTWQHEIVEEYDHPKLLRLTRFEDLCSVLL